MTTIKTQEKEVKYLQSPGIRYMNKLNMFQINP